MDRLDRIEGILEKVTVGLEKVTLDLGSVTLDLGKVTRDLEKVNITLDRVAARQEEMAARQQYHDEAFERFDVRMREIQENSAKDGEHIRALVRIAELHSRRLEGLEGGSLA